MLLKCSNSNGARGSSDSCSASAAGDEESSEPPNLRAGPASGRQSPSSSPPASSAAAPFDHRDVPLSGAPFSMASGDDMSPTVTTSPQLAAMPGFGGSASDKDLEALTGESITNILLMKDQSPPPSPVGKNDNNNNNNDETSSDTSFDFDHYLQSTVGDFGRYQQFVVWFLCIPACFVSAYGSLDLVFIAFTPEHHCDVEKSFKHYSSIDPFYSSNSTNARAISGDKCEFEVVNNDPSVLNRSNIERLVCTNWVYDTSYFQETLITRFDLVCSKAITARTMMSMLNLAVLFAAIYTYLGDRWGRKTAFLINLTVFLAGSLSSLMAPNPIVFGFLKFFGGITCMWEICYTWALEFVGTEQRTAMTTMLSVIYCVATMSLALIAYLCQTWIEFGLSTTAPFILLFAYCLFVPESPRWLITQGRYDDAVKVIARMARWQNMKIDLVELRKAMAVGSAEQKAESCAKMAVLAENKTSSTAALLLNGSRDRLSTADSPVSSDDLKGIDVVVVENPKSIVDDNQSAVSVETVGSGAISLTEFITNSNLMGKSMFLTTIEVMSNQLYFAIPYSLETLSANFYLSYVLQAAVEAPATLLNLLLLNRFGRVVPLCCSLMLSGTCCLLTIAVDPFGNRGAGWLSMTLVVVARFFICTSVAISEQLGGELFPTVARGTGQGLSYLVSSVTSLAMQYILYSANLWRHLPMLIFGTTVLMASAMALFLPETMGHSLPDTVRQAERQGAVGFAALRKNIPRLLKFLRRRRRSPEKPHAWSLPPLAINVYDPMLTVGKV